MGSYKYELVVVHEERGHEGEYVYIADLLEDGKKIGTYELPDYGGPSEFSFVSEDKKKEFSDHAVERFGDDYDTLNTLNVKFCELDLIEAMFEEMLAKKGL